MKRSIWALGLVSLVGAVIVGCSESNNSTNASSNNSAPLTVNGTVATGAPIIGATVSIKDANGVVVSAVTNGGGFYQFNGNPGQLTTPFALEVSGGNLNGLPNTLVLHSLSAQGGNINVTPLTEFLFAALLRSTNPSNTFSNLTNAQRATITQANIDAISRAISQALFSGSLNGQLLTGITGPVAVGNDFVGTPFQANGQGADAVLDALRRAVANYSILTNNFANANLPLVNGGTAGTTGGGTTGGGTTGGGTTGGGTTGGGTTGGGTTGGGTTGGSNNGTTSKIIIGGNFSYTITPRQGFNGSSTPVSQQGLMSGVFVTNTTTDAAVGPQETSINFQTNSTITNGLILGIKKQGLLSNGEVLPVISDPNGSGCYFTYSRATGPIGGVNNVTHSWTPGNATLGNCTINSVNANSINVTFNLSGLSPNPSVSGNQAAGTFDITGTFVGNY